MKIEKVWVWTAVLALVIGFMLVKAYGVTALG